MGFRFRKSFKVAPGVRLNLGKKSASVSFGGKGARHTISTTGRRTSSVGYLDQDYTIQRAVLLKKLETIQIFQVTKII